MQPQGNTHQRERLAEALREEIGVILEGELADPRIGLVTVTEVRVGAGRKYAHIFVSVTGDDKVAEDTMAGLQAALGYVKHELTERLKLRHCPELHFHLDRSEQNGGRIDELLRRAEKSQSKSKPQAQEKMTPGE